jgi:hypothetical protein
VLSDFSYRGMSGEAADCYRNVTKIDPWYIERSIQSDPGQGFYLIRGVP